MGDPVDMGQIFFTNLLLLGFDTAAMERKWRIPFNKDMFVLPNKKGFETVMHFLFDRLSAVKCKEMFRDCWPVIDKKREQLFRKCCHTWLSQIVEEDGDAVLPRIVPSTFMSPGGNKFVELLMYFSVHVLLKVSQNDNGIKRKDHLQHPVVTSQALSSGLASVMNNVMQCSAVRLRTKFLAHVKQTCVVQEKWRDYAVDQVKMFRSLTKAHREKERQLRSELSQAAEQGSLSGSPISARRKSGLLQYDYDIQSVKRGQKVQKVRDLWHSLHEYLESTEKDKQVIDSLIEGSLDKCKIDASELNIKVPDLLLRQCEQEIHRRGVENIYVGGKLNLLSLIQLWNLSLHLYIDKLNRTGLPKFADALPRMTHEVHTHHVSLNDLQSLRLRLEREVLPQVKESIKTMKAKLEKELFKDKSPDSLRTTSLGLGLLPQTPPVGFEPDDTETPATNIRITLSPAQVSTPDAVAELISEIGRRVRAKQSKDVQQGSPLSCHTSYDKTDTQFTSRLPTCGYTTVEDTGYKQRIHFTSASEAKSVEQSVSKQRMSRQGMKHPPLSERQVIGSSRTQTRRPNARQIQAPTKTTTSGSTSNADRPTAGHKGNTEPMIQDVLADKIAEAMVGLSPEVNEYKQEVDFLQDPLSYLHSNDADAFCSKDKLHHSLPKTGHRLWHDSLLHDSIGPLSSTRMDQSTRISVNKKPTDPLATKLFTLGGSDYEDGTCMDRPDHGSDLASKMATKQPHHRPDLDRIRAASPLIDNLPSSISSISPQSDRSSIKISDRGQNTLINEIELTEEDEQTLEGDLERSNKNLIRANEDVRTGPICQSLNDHLEAERARSSGSLSGSDHLLGTNKSSLSVERRDDNDDGQSLLDPEDSVRVIKFQNGSFSEFLDKSPVKGLGQSESDVHTPSESPSKSQLRAMKKHLDETTESLLSQYQELADTVKSPQRIAKPVERFLTENDVLRGGTRPKPLPLISKTPTMSFLDSYINCSPPPGKYGNITVSDDSQSYVIKKLTLDWNDESDEDAGTGGGMDCMPESGSTDHSSHRDEIHRQLVALSPQSAHRVASKQRQQPAESLTRHLGGVGFLGDEAGLMDERSMLLPDDFELGLNNTPLRESADHSTSHDVQLLNLSTIPMSPYTDRLHQTEHKLQTWTNDLFNEDASCLVQGSPSVPSERVGKLIDI